MKSISKNIIWFINLFYPPFRKLMPGQTFRYAVCGGTNTIIGLMAFKIWLAYFSKNGSVDIGFYVLKPHNAALFISVVIVFVTGFTLMKFVVFIDSNLRGRIQLFRYMLTFIFNLSLNYFLLKIFVEVIGWKPFLGQCFSTIIIITISYMSQKYFSFRITGKAQSKY